MPKARRDEFSSLDEELESLEQTYLKEFAEVAKEYLATAVRYGDRKEMMVRSMAPVLSCLSSRRHQRTAKVMSETVEGQWQTMDQMKLLLERMERQSKAMGKQTKGMLAFTVILTLLVVLQIVIATVAVIVA